MKCCSVSFWGNKQQRWQVLLTYCFAIICLPVLNCFNLVVAGIGSQTVPWVTVYTLFKGVKTFLPFQGTVAFLWVCSTLRRALTQKSALRPLLADNTWKCVWVAWNEMSVPVWVPAAKSNPFFFFYQCMYACKYLFLVHIWACMCAPTL